MLKKVLALRGKGGGAKGGAAGKNGASRAAARQRNRMFGILEQSYQSASPKALSPMWSGSVGSVIGVLRKAPHERSEEDVARITSYLAKDCAHFKYFKGKSMKTLQQLAAVLGVTEVAPNSPVFCEGDVADLLYILVSGNVTVMLQQSAEDLAEAKEAREAIAAGRAKPLAERQRVFLEEVGVRSRHTSHDNAAQPLGTRSAQAARNRWKSVGKAVAASSRLSRMLSTLKSAMQHNRVVGTVEPGGHFGELSLQTTRAAPRCTSAYTTKHSLFLTLDKHTHLRLRKFDPDPQDFADYFRFFHNLDVFSTLTTPQLARLTYSTKEWTATRGTIVAREGVLTPSIVFVRTGSCKVEKKTPKSALPFELGIIGQGQFFGEKSVLFHLPSDFTVTCETSTTFLSVSAEDLWPFKRYTQALFVKHARNKHKWHTHHFKDMEATAMRYQPRPRPLVKPVHAARSLHLAPSSRALLEESGSAPHAASFRKSRSASGVRNRPGAAAGAGARAWFGTRAQSMAGEGGLGAVSGPGGLGAPGISGFGAGTGADAPPSVDVQRPKTTAGRFSGAFAGGSLLVDGFKPVPRPIATTPSVLRRPPSMHVFVGVKEVHGVIVSGPETQMPAVEEVIMAALADEPVTKVPLHLTPGHSRRRSSLEVAASNLRPFLNEESRQRVLQRSVPATASAMSSSGVFSGAMPDPTDHLLTSYHGHSALPAPTQLSSAEVTLRNNYYASLQHRRKAGGVAGARRRAFDPVSEPVPEPTTSLARRRRKAAAAAAAAVHGSVTPWGHNMGPHGAPVRADLRSDTSAYPLPRGGVEVDPGAIPESHTTPPVGRSTSASPHIPATSDSPPLLSSARSGAGQGGDGDDSLVSGGGGSRVAPGSPGLIVVAEHNLDDALQLGVGGDDDAGSHRSESPINQRDLRTNVLGAYPTFSLPIEFGPNPPIKSVRRISMVDVPETELTLEQALAKRMADQARARTAAEAAAATHLGPNDPMVHLRAALMESHAVERGRNALASRRQSASLDSARRDTMRATGRRGTAAKLRHGSSQAGRRASSPAGRSAGGTRPGTRAGTRPGTAQSRTDGGGEGGGGGTRRSRLFQNEQLQLAAEEHSHRQRQLERVEGLLAASKHLLGARPPAYEWEREVGAGHRSVLNSLDGGGPDFARLAKIGAQPLRRKGLAGFMTKKNGRPRSRA